MIVGIDASNIRAGGGLTHLIELITNANPQHFDIESVIIWSNNNTLSRIPDKPWLTKYRHSFLEKTIFHRFFWQKFIFKSQLKEINCSILFTPGGTDSSNFKPLVSMSQNMLPFEWKELFRFKLSFLTLKLLLLRHTQGKTFSKSDGIIFLTNYAQSEITKRITITKPTQVIPHGIDERFFSIPKEQYAYPRENKTFKIIYVSIVDMYKHQWNVAEAIAIIRSSGIPVTLDLIGPAYKPALTKLNKYLDKIDPKREFITYHGAIPYTELHKIYASSDINVFASSCENLPNILLEAMASGIPIACSNFGPMPEVLGDAGIYFNPEKPSEIAHALLELIKNPDLRLEKSLLAHQRAKQFTWQKCSDDTFQFIAEVAQNWKAHHIEN